MWLRPRFWPLVLDAYLEGGLAYSGPLLDFLSATTTFSPLADEWLFEVGLPLGEAGFGGDEFSCSFDFPFAGWQAPVPLLDPFGFHDEEAVSTMV